MRQVSGTRAHSVTAHAHIGITAGVSGPIFSMNTQLSLCRADHDYCRFQLVLLAD